MRKKMLTFAFARSKNRRASLSKNAKIMKKIILSALFLLSAAPLCAQQPTETEKKLEAIGLVNIQDVDPTIQVDMALERNDNFTKKALYTDLHTAYLHPQAAKALKRAQETLKKSNPELSLKVYDAARPISVQWELYKAVLGTDKVLYINSPKSGGDQHNYGLAVDVTLCDAATGDTLEMGTRLGDLTHASGTAVEEQSGGESGLSDEAKANRALLRRVMTVGGFKALRNEWWHFNFRTRSEARANYRPIP